MSFASRESLLTERGGGEGVGHREENAGGKCYGKRKKGGRKAGSLRWREMGKTCNIA